MREVSVVVASGGCEADQAAGLLLIDSGCENRTLSSCMDRFRCIENPNTHAGLPLVPPRPFAGFNQADLN